MTHIDRLHQITGKIDKSINKLHEVSLKEGKFGGKVVKKIVSDLNQLIRFFKTLFSSGPTVWKSDAAVMGEKFERHFSNLKAALNVERQLVEEGVNDEIAMNKESVMIESLVLENVKQMIDVLKDIKSKMSKKEKDGLKTFEDKLDALRAECEANVQTAQQTLNEDNVSRAQEQLKKQTEIAKPTQTLGQESPGVHSKKAAKKAKKVERAQVKHQMAKKGVEAAAHPEQKQMAKEELEVQASEVKKTTDELKETAIKDTKDVMRKVFNRLLDMIKNHPLGQPIWKTEQPNLQKLITNLTAENYSQSMADFSGLVTKNFKTLKSAVNVNLQNDLKEALTELAETNKKYKEVIRQ